MKEKLNMRAVLTTVRERRWLQAVLIAIALVLVFLARKVLLQLLLILIAYTLVAFGTVLGIVLGVKVAERIIEGGFARGWRNWGQA